jgi:hypothetical protein
MVDDPSSSRHEDRKHFMKRKKNSIFDYLASFADPMKKREEFSVSLRKIKKSEIIMSKRKRKPEE